MAERFIALFAQRLSLLSSASFRSILLAPAARGVMGLPQLDA
jgi:hypothetical protein